MLDLLILLALAVGFLRGWGTGLVRQVASLAGLLLAFSFGVQLAGPVGRIVADSIGASARVAPVLGFVVVFLAVEVAAFAVVRFVETVIGKLKMSVLNRAGGGALGAAKAALLVGVGFLILGAFGTPGPEARAASVLYQPVASFLPAAWDQVADHLPRLRTVSQQFGERMRTEIEER